MNKKTKTEAGFISLETLIAAGFMLGIGIVGLIVFKDETAIITDAAMDKVSTSTVGLFD